jgi:hypothetical protein
MQATRRQPAVNPMSQVTVTLPTDRVAVSRRARPCATLRQRSLPVSAKAAYAAIVNGKLVDLS